MIAAALGNIGLPDATIAVMLVLLVLPAMEAGLSFFNKLVLISLTPTRLVGYEFKHGVPAAARTLVVVPSLIGSRDDVDESLRNLEVHFLANMIGDIHFALLSDWPDSTVEMSAGDREVLDYARGEIKLLNERHPLPDGERFHLLHRRRLYNEAEGCWMGWERKRGKLHELNLLLRGDSDTTFLPSETALPPEIVHVMTLDADTRMTRDAVTRLAGKLSHALNRPRIDAATGRVVRGYGILQPRVTASLTTGDEASFFQRIFSANRGLDPYVFSVSDLYQDVFDDGTFTGKGMYHIDAVEAALRGSIAENEVLSHDLLEGALAHAALVSDVELVEDYPTRYDVDASRQHRWARGDWQLLPYIFGRRGAIPSLSRWKMIDNLRRTLTPISWVIASIAGWTTLPFDACHAVPGAARADAVHGADLRRRRRAHARNPAKATPRGHFSALLRDAVFASAQVALRVVLVAHSAWLMGDAIVRTLYRLFSQPPPPAGMAHRLAGAAGRRQHAGRLLPHDVRRRADRAGRAGDPARRRLDRCRRRVNLCAVLGRLAGFRMAGQPLGGDRGPADRRGGGQGEAARLSGGAPGSISRPSSRPSTTCCRRTISRSCRRRWSPLAHRRPISASICCRSLSARDFGWIGLANAAERLEATIATIEKMETLSRPSLQLVRNHALRPLHPLYVSSVDSGNLAGHLIAVSAACNEWSMAPAAFLEGDFHGLLDVVTILGESLDAVPDDRRQLRPLRQRLRERISGMRRAIDTVRNEPETAAIRTLNLVVLAGEIRKLPRRCTRRRSRS